MQKIFKGWNNIAIPAVYPPENELVTLEKQVLLFYRQALDMDMSKQPSDWLSPWYGYHL